MALIEKEDGFHLILENNDEYVISTKDKLNPLGKGAVGVVYRATKLGTTESYAVKEVSIDKVNITTLDREIQILEKMSQYYVNGACPHVVCTYGKARDANYMYIVMPFMDHGDLDEYLKKERQYQQLSEAESIEIIRQILIGYQYLHKNNIIHRDLKPANVLLRNEKISNNFQYTLYIGDFGTSKALINDEQTNMLVGSRITMAPEILSGNFKYSTEPDVYSIGAILYRLMNGDYPLNNGENSDDNGLFIKMKQQCSEFMMYVIEGCLQIDPRYRLTSEDLNALFNIEYGSTQIKKFCYFPFDSISVENKIYINCFPKKQYYEENFGSRFLSKYLETGVCSVFFNKIKEIINERKEPKPLKKLCSLYDKHNINSATSTSINSVTNACNISSSTDVPMSPKPVVRSETKIPVNMNSPALGKSTFQKQMGIDLLICPPGQSFEFYKAVSSDHSHSYLQAIAKKILTGNGIYITSDISMTSLTELDNFPNTSIEQVVIFDMDVTSSLIKNLIYLITQHESKGIGLVLYNTTINEVDKGSLAKFIIQFKFKAIYISRSVTRITA